MTDDIRSSVEATETLAVDCARGLAPAGEGCPDTAETAPLPAGMAGDGKGKSPAEWAYERLILYIRKFEEQLDPDQEVAMGFAGSDAGVLRIEGIGWFAPDILSFYGRDEDGARMQAVQHVSQLNMLLRAMPKSPESETGRRIGFHLAEGLGLNLSPPTKGRSPRTKKGS